MSSGILITARNDPSTRSRKPSSPYSPLIARLRSVDNRSELESLLRVRILPGETDGRGNLLVPEDAKFRQPISPEEGDAAIQAWKRILAGETGANRELVFSYAGLRTEDVHQASDAILEWVWRVSKKIYGHCVRRVRPDDLLAFAVVPELWTRLGDPTPLHHHMVIKIPETWLPWFDDPQLGAQKIWNQLAPARIAARSWLFVDDIYYLNGMADYTTKYCSIDWVFQNTLVPHDLAKYRARARPRHKTVRSTVLAGNSSRSSP